MRYTPRYFRMAHPWTPQPPQCRVCCRIPNSEYEYGGHHGPWCPVLADERRLAERATAARLIDRAGVAEHPPAPLVEPTP